MNYDEKNRYELIIDILSKMVELSYNKSSKLNKETKYSSNKTN